jgi:acyl-lipid omega-6 desaturase (Delta-12 desaturase)
MKKTAPPSNLGPNVHSFEAFRAAIPQNCFVRSVPLGVAAMVAALGVYTIATAVLYTASVWWLLVIGAIARGLTIGPIFIVGHDACHDALTPFPKLNRVLGQVAFLPSMHSFTAWKNRHNFTHHRHTQILELDSGYPPLTPAQYNDLPRVRKLAYRASRSAAFVGWLYFPEWLSAHFLPDKAMRAEHKKAGRYFALDHFLIMSWLGLELALFSGLAAKAGWVSAPHFPVWVMLLFGVFVTQFVWNWQMGFVTFLHHFHPQVSWYREAEAPPAATRQLTSTVHMSFPAGTHWAMLNILEHTAHHIDPKIPLYHLPRAQAALNAEFSADIRQERMTPAAALRAFSVCKLWDAEQHKWAGFKRADKDKAIGA